MDKLITNNGYRCSCNGMTDDALVKVVQGNDIELDVQLTKYDTEQEIWESYSLVGKDDVQCYLLTPNGTHIDLDTEIQLDGKVKAKAESYQLETNMTYGIGVDWKDDEKDMSVKAKGMVKVVRYSEVTEDYEITVTDNATYISIGQLPEDYITPDELTTVLDNYVTNSSLDTTLNDYVQDSDLDNYVTDTDLSTVLEDYITETDMSNYYNKTEVDNMLSDYVTDSELATSLNPYVSDSELTTTLANYVTSTSLNTTLNNYVTDTELTTALNPYVTDNQLSSTLQLYVTSSALSTTLNDYVTDSELTTELSPIESDITSLDGRVTTLEQNPSVPSNVVTSDDANEIVLLTQSEYDALVNGGTVDPDALYYITDTTSNYVTDSELTSELSPIESDISSLDTRVTALENGGGGGGTPTNMVTTDTTQTISGTKTFTANNTFDGESKFIDTQNNHTVSFSDNCYEITKSGIFGRGSFIQACIGQILAPRTAVSNSTNKYDNQVGTILFQTINGSTGSPNYNPSGLTTIAKIDSNGIYEGTTLLANKYVQSSSIRNIVQISQSDYDNLVNGGTVDANTMYVII